ncbi:MAG: HlyD family secretion protein [Lysobacterales bacterium]|nr:MAG: HlyD family secretion protein [Xanthomonadales bacterium]
MSPPTETPAGGIRHRGFQRSLIFVVLLAALVLGIREIHDRLVFVSESDARVTANLVVVSSRVAGWLTEVNIVEGAQVKAKQVVARVDERDSRLRAQQLEAQLASTDSEKARLAAERELVDQQTASRLKTQRKQLAAANASVTALDARLELALSERARAQSLFDKRVGTRQQLEQARGEAGRIEGEHRMTLAEAEESTAKLEEARAERARLQVLDRELDMLNDRKAELRVRIAQQNLDISDHSIRSPVSGVVDRVFVEPGEYATPGQRLAIVHDPEQIWVEANIKETAIRKLSIGQKVAITVDAFPDETFDGQITTIGNSTTGSFALLPTPNPSGNFTKITQRLPVRICIEQRQGKLRPGMMVEVEIDVRGR